MNTEMAAKEAEARLHALEAENQVLRMQLCDMTEHFSDACFAVDREWQLIYINAPGAMLLRKPAEELVGHSLWELFPEAVDTVLFEQSHLAIQEQRPITFEAYYSPWQVSFSVRVYPSSAGLSVYLREIPQQRTDQQQQDINAEPHAQSDEREIQAKETWKQRDEQQRLTEALECAREEAEQQAAILRAIFDSTHACLALLDRNFTFLMVNMAYVQTCGHSLEELLGRNHFGLFPNEENEQIFTRVRETGEPYIANEKPFEYIDQPWRGVTYWNWILAPICNIRGETESLLLSLTDVTPQVRARQQVEMLAEEARHRAAVLDATFNAIVDGVVVYGSQGEILQVNPEFERLLGYSAADLDKSLSERMQILHPEDAEGHPFQAENTPMWRALHGETVHGEIIQITRPDGRRLCISLSGGPIRGEGGTILGAISTYTDVTPLLELQEQQRIFLHMVSHDLRSPMAVINGHAALLIDMLGEIHVPATVTRSLEAIQRGIHRMDVMIDDLVDAARLEGRQYQLKRHSVDMHAFLSDLLDRSSSVIDSSRIQLSLSSTLPAVFADRDRLERIAINLLSNALKYSTPGTPVRVVAEPRDGEVIISVIDRGQGITPDELPKLFQRFYRATNRKAEGIGLGLYIARLLVEAHSGRIWVESQPGEGSTFAFSLPVVDFGTAE